MYLKWPSITSAAQTNIDFSSAEETAVSCAGDWLRALPMLLSMALLRDTWSTALASVCSWSQR